MQSFIKIFQFELQYRFRRWDTYIYFLAFLLFSFYSIHGSTLFVNYGGAGQRVYANSSITISYFISHMSIWLIAIAAALMSVPVIRDRETKAANFYFALPITKSGYLLGRFLGTLVILLIIATAVLVGITIGYLMPGHDPATLQPFKAIYFIWPFFVLIIFNIVIASLIFFSMVTLTRNVLGGYMTAVLIIALNMIAQRFFNPEDLTLYCYLDPYGEHAFFTMIRGWNIVQRNTALVPMESWMLYNRLLWLGIGLILFLIGYIRFDFGRWMQDKQSARKIKEDTSAKDARIAIPTVNRTFRFKDNLHHLFFQTKLELSYHLKTIFFIVMIFAAGFILFYDGISLTYPTTGYVLEIKNGYFSIFALIILVFFAGEAVNRERELKLAHITDALPIPDWIFTGSKLLSIIGIAFILSTLVLVAMFFSILYKGYPIYNPGVYLLECYGIVFPYYALLAVLAFGIQVLVKNKFVGHTIMILFFILNVIAKSLGIEHNLLFYGAPPKPGNGPLSGWAGYNIDYSEMNGYEPYLAGRTWFTIYWLIFAILLTIVVNLLWKRGIELNFRERLRLMKSRINKAAILAFGVFGIALIACGSYIFYNTNVLNEYLPQTSEVPFQKRADYEKKYKSYAALPVPWVTDINVDADIYPTERKTVMNIRYSMENRTTKAIDTLIATLPPQLKLESFTVKGYESQSIVHDPRLQFFALKLAKSILPGEHFEMVLNTKIHPQGFKNETQSDIARFSSKYMSISSDMDFPILGYEPRVEIGANDARVKYGLAPRTASSSQQPDTTAKYKNIWSANSDWVNINITVSTDNSHTAIAPGKLLKQWSDHQRNYFSYSTAGSKQPPSFDIYSGQFLKLERYWVSKDMQDSARIELYVHPRHTTNADSVFNISKNYLDYLHYTGGKQPLNLLRFVEMPYNGGSLSENSMLAHFDYAGPNFMDYRVSQAVLKEYFSNALAPAAFAGAGVYGSLTNKYTSSGISWKYGSNADGKIFYQPLQNYLTGRAEEKIQERPIFNTYNITYMSGKMDMAFGNLSAMLGDSLLNTYLLEFRESHAFQGPPYLLSEDLITFLRTHVPDSMHQRFDEYFYKVIVYRNKVRSIKATQTDDKRYRIEVEVEKHKFEDDGAGNEKPIKDEEYVDMGIFTMRNPPEARIPDIITSVKLTDGINRLVFYSDAPPTKVMIDPRYLLVNLNLLSGKNDEWKKVNL
ncbi:hypothetical protein DVR12_05865 [Chitinophaga silvatica]|uniref:Uncharacterized protein n=1 Tax=Chitinophaga silvatica TaxID=2282649 RepID=A0A3E1YE47_9BACT|nr:ABC transporter permease subunit [Chitinophaga silvatica]RFS24723.1 hypothetical protein DVR12_05865 [Chitinophaga silvatica]